MTDANEHVIDALFADLNRRLALLIGVQLEVLRLPRSILMAFEPSQIGTVVGVLMDACIPELPGLLKDQDIDLSMLGLSKHEGILGDREGYPDYHHDSGARLELKLLYKDPEGAEMKTPPTPREPSARLTQKVTLKNVDPERDVLMVLAYELRPLPEDRDLYSPTIIDIGLFSMIDCIHARDDRLTRHDGKWFGDYETPCVPSRIGRKKLKCGEALDDSLYGRKESEGKDFNEDTNFGKLKRVPYKPLQLYLKKHGAIYTAKGNWPKPWTIPATADVDTSDPDENENGNGDSNGIDDFDALDELRDDG